MTSALNPTARPPKPPALASMPSTPGPELPGGYPRNSVVFANNQWDRSTAPKKKRGLLASFLPTNASTSTSSSSASPARPRQSSIGHTPGIALHLDADSDSSAPTPGDFPTPGGHTFASRASSGRQPTKSTSAEGDYFGAAAAAAVAESNATASSSTADPADVARGPTKVVEPAHGAEPAADAPSNSLPLPLPLPVQPPANASPSTLASSNSSGGTSALSTSTAPSSVPSSSSSPSPLPISSPKPLARQTSPASAPTSTSSTGTDNPRPSITYSPSTFGARPAVTKAGSALSPFRRSFSVARSAGAEAGAIAEGAEGSTNSVSPGSSGGPPVTGRGLGSAMKRYTSLRLRRRGDKSGAQDAGGHARAASSSAASPGSPALSSPAPASPSAPAAPISSPSELGVVVAEGGGKSASAKPSRRASLMRTLRGVAGRVGVRG